MIPEVLVSGVQSLPLTTIITIVMNTITIDTLNYSYYYYYYYLKLLLLLS